MSRDKEVREVREIETAREITREKDGLTKRQMMRSAMSLCARLGVN